jgi:disulfide bond formation protein DsbB
MIKKIAPYAYHIGLVQATIAMVGSLYLSDIAGYPPCLLCWYQRIAMYPLVVIFAVAIHRQDKTAWYYAFPITIIGWIIAIYHNLLYFKILPESIKPCQAGISCTSKYIEWFGFITIPFLAFVAFSVILVGLIAYYRVVLRPTKQ